MTLRARVIATVLYNGEAVVKGRAFAADRVIGTPRQVLRVFAARDVDELVFLDVRRGTPPDLELIEDLAADASFPLAVGGGIRSVNDARAVIRAGADKVVIGRAKDAIRECADALGSQAVVASVDHSDNAPDCICLDRAAAAEHAGAGEILLQHTDRDGRLEGYDTHLIEDVAHWVSVPVIASGGCAGPADMVAAVRAGAAAVAAGALFAFTDTTPATCRAFMREHGVAVRA